MLREIFVDLSNIVLSLSDAIDLASPEIACHQMRCAYIAWQMGHTAGFSSKRAQRLFIAALLHDIGALTPEDKAKLHAFEEEEAFTHCRRGEILFQSAPLLKAGPPLC